jgi:excisionase family DNA binding protein
MAPHSRPRYARATDVAAELNVSLRTVRAWTASGLLPCYKLGRCVFYRWEDIDQAIRDHRQAAPPLAEEGAGGILPSAEEMAEYERIMGEHPTNPSHHAHRHRRRRRHH